MRLGVRLFTPPSGTSPREAFSYSLARAQDLGVQVLNGNPPADATSDELARYREQAEAAGLELEPSCLANYCSIGDEARRVRERVIAALRTARQLGSRRLRTMADRRTNRFTKCPPLAEQLGMIEANLRVVAKAAQELGIALALENHCDYRGSEIAELIRRVGSPWLRAALDTGNAYVVFEDPLDAAAALAPYSITTHLKDFRIEAMGLPGRVPWTPVGCALGEGNVDLAATVELLAHKVPDPRSLPLVVEVNWPRLGESEDELTVRSIRYLRDHFGSHLQ